MNLKKMFSRKSLLLIGLLLFVQITAISGVHFTESFTGAFDVTYASGTAVLGSGTWEYGNIRGELSANSYGATGGAARFNKNIVGGSYITTPAVNTVGSISFYYSELNSGGGTITIQKSVNGGAFTTIGTQAFSGNTFTLYTLNVNETGNNVKIKVLSINNPGYLILDEFTVTSYTADPLLSVTQSSLSGFTYVFGNGPSTSQNYNLSGTNLTGYPGNIVVTAPTNYEVSLNNSSFATTQNVAYSSATLASTTIYVRLKASLAINTYNGETISNAGGGATTVNVTCSGSVTSPPPATLNISTTSLSGFTYIVGNGPSTSQSYSLSGSNLTGYPGNITVTAPTNYEVSLNNSTFANTQNVAYTTATLSSTTIYVRLKAGLAINTYNGETISNAGGGATTVNVTCNGSVTSPPPATLNVSPTSLSGFTYIVGNGPSTSQSYNLSGSNLTGYPGNITVAAPSNFEVSLNNSTFAGIQSVAYSSATLASTPIYVRLKTGLAVNNYNSELLSNSGGGATNVNVTCSGSVTNTPPATLLVSPTSLSGFTYVVGNGPSSSQSYSLSGSNLTGYPGNITITAPTNYEVSLNNSTFAGTQNVSFTSATLASTPIYVRLKTGLAVSSYNSELVSNSGGGATTVNVTCSGNVSDVVTGPCLSEGFDGGFTAPSGWTFTGITATYTSAGNFGASSPSIKFDGTGDRVETPSVSNATELKFWIKGQTTDAASALLVEGWDGSAWQTVQNITNSIPTVATTKTYNASSTPALAPGFSKFRFTYTKSAGNLAFDDVEVSCGAAPSPEIMVNPTSLDFGDQQTGTTSIEKTYVVTGNDLTGDITINAPSAYEISTTTGAGFASSLILTPSSGNVNQTIYVRFKPTLVQVYNGVLSHTSAGASNVDLNLSGTGIAPPTPVITLSSLPTSYGDLCINSISGEKTYIVSGSDLIGDITITPPLGYEISLTSGSGFVANPASLNITPSSGSIGNTTIYVRFVPADVQVYNGDIIHTSSGAVSQNVALTGVGINTLPVIDSPTSANITITTADLGGTITSLGCLDVLARGIIWSDINGFEGSEGVFAAETLGVNTTGSFSLLIDGLEANTTYYYKAFIATAIDTIYTSQSSFTTNNIVPDQTSIIEQPISQIADQDISSDIISSIDAIDVFKFSITDDGFADALPTIVTQIQVKKSFGTADLTDHLAGAEIWSNGSIINTNNVIITDSEITFQINPGDLNIANNSSKEISMKIWLNELNIVDSATMAFEISQTLHGFIADPAGSGFNSDFGISVIGNTMLVINETAVTDLQQTDFCFYPNPASECIYISVNENSNVSIIDITGKIITNKSIVPIFSNEIIKFSIFGLPKGLYIIQIINQHGSVFKRLIIN